MSTRILVTGSRGWTDNDTIRRALEPWRSAAGAVLVHGDAVGADRIAASIWRRWRLPTEEHRPDWATGDREAGMLRNRHMVGLGAQVCLAFIRDHSPGATHCAEAAERAGIPTYRHQNTTTPAATAQAAETDLFGNSLPPGEALCYQVTNDPDQVRAVLRIAHTDGYAVAGRRGERVWRLTGPGEITPVPGHEADTVRQLIDQQWLQIGGHHQYHHGGEDLDTRSVLVPRATRRRLTYWEGLRNGPGRPTGRGQRR